MGECPAMSPCCNCMSQSGPTSLQAQGIDANGLSATPSCLRCSHLAQRPSRASPALDRSCLMCLAACPALGTAHKQALCSEGRGESRPPWCRVWIAASFVTKISLSAGAWGFVFWEWEQGLSCACCTQSSVSLQL